jgi:hypothetical protein
MTIFLALIYPASVAYCAYALRKFPIESNVRKRTYCMILFLAPIVIFVATILELKDRVRAAGK